MSKTQILKFMHINKETRIATHRNKKKRTKSKNLLYLISRGHGTYTQIDHNLSPKTNLSKFKRIKVI